MYMLYRLWAPPVFPVNTGTKIATDKTLVLLARKLRRSVSIKAQSNPPLTPRRNHPQLSLHPPCRCQTHMVCRNVHARRAPGSARRAMDLTLATIARIPPQPANMTTRGLAPIRVEWLLARQAPQSGSEHAHPSFAN
jgi:hypothetical protein